MYYIAKAKANRDHTIDIEWQHGASSTVDFKATIAKGGVFTPMADPEFFATKMYVADDGYYLGWPEEIDFSADSLWYRTHPEDLERDYGVSSAAE